MESSPKPEQSEAEHPPDGDSADADETTDGPIGGRLSRRALLGGAGASVALLGVGGAGWMYLQDGGKGNAVIKSYLDAMSAGNWSQAADLYHQDAPVFSRIEESREFDDYEGYLRQQSSLETWEDIDPELDAIQEFYHATEVTEESVANLRISLGAESVEMINEVRSAIAFLAIEPENLSRGDGATEEDNEGQNVGEYYEDGTRNNPLTCNLVLVDGEWLLWTARGVGLY
jgi:hypothetical protein